LSRENKKALFYHAEPRSQNRGGEALRSKTKLFWSPGTIWPPCDKGECKTKDDLNACKNLFWSTKKGGEIANIAVNESDLILTKLSGIFASKMNATMKRPH